MILRYCSTFLNTLYLHFQRILLRLSIHKYKYHQHMKMKDHSQTPLVSDLVLIGGGHAQVHIIKMCGMEPLKSLIAHHGIRVTLIARDVMTPYSGMLPGYIAGHYTYEQIHIDLNRLCSFAGVRLIHTAANRIVANGTDTNTDSDPTGSLVRHGGLIYCEDGRPPIRYDALSIDIGSRPSGWGNSAQEINEDGITPVKPIAGFAMRYAKLIEKLQKVATQFTPENPFIFLIVGGGAGGIELVLSAQYNLTQIFQKAGADIKALKFILATRGTTILPSHNSKIQSIFQRILKERGVEVIYGAAITGMESYNPQHQQDESSSSNNSAYSTIPQLHKLITKESSRTPPIVFHECLWCTSAGVSSWLAKDTPFETTSDGFLKVNDTFQCLGFPGVFAAGDCCHSIDHPRPKAGVFAVRAGPPVLKNLFHYLLNEPLEPYVPQSTFLSLISTGNKYAVASRGSFALEGQYLWTWKDSIDVTFMNKFSDLPQMESSENNDESALPANVVAKGAQAMAAFAAAPMRCGGCGAKVGATTVSRVLEAVRQRVQTRKLSLLKNGTTSKLQPDNRTSTDTRANTNTNTFDADDAAVVSLPANRNGNGNGGGSSIHTIDFFRSFISDPFIFGKIAAVHAMSDCHAMGASTQTCLALAVVPYSAEESITEDTLVSMLSGASDVLEADHCDLVGGHTCEGAELALGFAVNGYIDDASRLLRKRGGKVGDKIILTKPIGTGAIFAADMRAESKSIYVKEALDRMVQSSGPASRLAMSLIEIEAQQLHGTSCVHSCTDVTGFGLAGHLLEMLTANDYDNDNDNDSTSDSIGAILDINQIPFYQGALDASRKGIYSSLQRENARARRAVTNHTQAAQKYPTEYPLIFDPQTAGGLLFFVSADFCDEFVTLLQQPEHGGFACVIGELTKYEKASSSYSMEETEGVCTIGGGSKDAGKRITIRVD